MLFDLDKKGLISLISGSQPKPEDYTNPFLLKYGFYTGGFADHWAWYQFELNDLSEEELANIYKTYCNG